MSGPKRLVLTFDAFGTLFTPREPIAKSYADIARSHGLSGFTNDEIASGFREAFKQESKHAPNYGKKVGIDATHWWSNVKSFFLWSPYMHMSYHAGTHALTSGSGVHQVINSTFRPFTQSAALPKQLVPDLLNHFSSSHGYMLYPDVPPLFRLLRELKEAVREKTATTTITVGIITNSDDRVPSILSSLGLSVGSLRHGTHPACEDTTSRSKEVLDIDFIVMSYDVGSEKPSRKIFDAAKDLSQRAEVAPERERYIHVGDDPHKDFEGATQAGWEGILLTRRTNDDASKPETPKPSIASLSELGQHIQRG